MRILLITLFIFFASLQVKAQLPIFLQGTWKMENKDIYEHWDVLTENRMKGVSYMLSTNKVTIIEYLDITRLNTETIYTATVPGHNDGKSIEFIQTETGDSVIFENSGHDFPQKIVYEKLSDTEIYVRLSGGDKKMSYKMIKYPVANSL